MSDYSKEWIVEYDNHIIKVTNIWNFKMKGEAILYLDGKPIDKNQKLFSNPTQVFLCSRDNSKDVGLIEVYIMALVTVKASIFVNGKKIYFDKLNIIEKIYFFFKSKFKK